MTKKSTSLRTAIITGETYNQKISGYASRFVKTAGGFSICSKCCHAERDRFATDDLWLIEKDLVNKSDPFLFCDHCNSRVEIFRKPANKNNRKAT